MTFSQFDSWLKTEMQFYFSNTDFRDYRDNNTVMYIREITSRWSVVFDKSRKIRG